MISWPLQKALYQRLAADAALMEEIGDPPRLYDDPPPDAAFPYVVLGEARAAPVPGADGLFEHDLRLHVHSRHAGRRDVKRILDRLYDALEGADFPVEGARLVSARFVFADVFRREEGVFTGVARFRLVTEETP